MGGGLDSRPRRGGGKYVQIKSNKKRDAKMKMNFMSINMKMKMGEKWSKERRQRTRTKATTQGPFGSGTTYSAFCCILLRVQVGWRGGRRVQAMWGCTGGWCSGGGVISVHNIVVGFLIYLLLFDSIRWR